MTTARRRRRPLAGARTHRTTARPSSTTRSSTRSPSASRPRTARGSTPSRGSAWTRARPSGSRSRSRSRPSAAATSRTSTGRQSSPSSAVPTESSRSPRSASSTSAATSSAGLLISPILIVAAIAIKLDDGGPDPVPPAARRPERSAVPDRQVPDDGPSTPTPSAPRSAPYNEVERQRVVQDDQRPADHAGRALVPADQHRRAAAAVERPARRDEPRRPPAAPVRRRRGVRRLAPPPPGHEARHHRAVADRRPPRDRLRPVGRYGPRVHRPLVALARLRPAEHPCLIRADGDDHGTALAIRACTGRRNPTRAERRPTGSPSSAAATSGSSWPPAWPSSAIRSSASIAARRSSASCAAARSGSASPGCPSSSREGLNAGRLRFTTSLRLTPSPRPSSSSSPSTRPRRWPARRTCATSAPPRGRSQRSSTARRRSSSTRAPRRSARARRSRDPRGRLDRAHRSPRIVSNPEFLRQGHAVEDFFNPDRDRRRRPLADDAAAVAAPLRGLARRRVVTDLRTAEMIKYVANSFLATRISFINEIARLCEAIGVGIDQVVEGIAHDPRIGDALLPARHRLRRELPAQGRRRAALHRRDLRRRDAGPVRASRRSTSPSARTPSAASGRASGRSRASASPSGA